MLFRMTTPRISKSRAITVRKGIPEDVRAEYQRLYGQLWEAKLTLPAGMKPQEAKVRSSEFIAEVETRIATLRAAQRAEGQSLTQRQALALAGEWYAWYVARHEENPGTVERWQMMWDVLIDRLEDCGPDWVIEEGWRDLEWTKEPEVRAGMRPLIADEAKTAQFLASRSMVLNTEAQASFLDCVLDEFMAASHGTQRCAPSRAVFGVSIAEAARRIVVHSSRMKASVSRCLTRLGSVTRKPLKGLDAINRSSCAHADAVRAAVSHTSLTVRALRLAVTSCCAHSLASSSVMSSALPKRCSRSRNTQRHLLTPEAAGCLAFTHASNSCHELILPVARAIFRPSNFGNSASRASTL
jgi:hypothetical protein